jgi:hypothetical protein
VVRGLAPAGALEAIGARPARFMTCVLPGAEAVPPRQVFGRPGCEAVLLAGQVGDWTFVYDGLGDTGYGEDPHRRYAFVSMAEILSAGAREAASGTFTIEADTSLSYAADGRLLLDAGEPLDPGEDYIPSGLRAAVEAAGTFGPAGERNRGPDLAVNIRVVCALAGLTLTPKDLRALPLTGAPLG